MKAVILQSNYIPWKGYFDLINDADLFIFYDEVQYTKNDWRNRNQIYTKNGLQWLTIPVGTQETKNKISEVQIDSGWQKIHAKSLTLGYKSAPFYYQLEELINDYLLEKEWTYLKELNQYLIKNIAEKIGINTGFKDSADFEAAGDKVSKLINILKQAGATEYISGPAGKDYLEGSKHLFHENDIKLIYKKYPEYKSYNQFNRPFVNNVSIVDMIAHLKYSEIPDFIWG